MSKSNRLKESYLSMKYRIELLESTLSLKSTKIQSILKLKIMMFSINYKLKWIELI